MVNLQNKLREYFRADISKYIIDLIIFTSISVIAIGGFNVLLQRWQKRYLSVLYLCGASWKNCMLTDILRGIIVISFPGAIALMVEWLRYWFAITNPGFSWIMSLLERLNLSQKTFQDITMFFVKNTISTGSKSGFYDVGLVIDNLTFLYSFLLIVGIHFLSTAWFHISMMRTKPTDVIRQWQ